LIKAAPLKGAAFFLLAKVFYKRLYHSKTIIAKMPNTKIWKNTKSLETSERIPIATAATFN